MKDRPLHTVVETEAYLTRCRNLALTDAMRVGIVDQVAADPSAGDLVRGSGGVRKVRYGGSGGHRIMVAYLGGTVPVYLLSILAKGQQANFTASQIATMYDLTKALKRYWGERLKTGDGL
ncbi:addiction module toxin RelE [Methylorubrum sp. POS3]|uniref:addiction module toxin RelE n=1 Tax=Methylorubrum sp. POS3 TaxID=2998492 RepID=UPI0037286654